MKWKQIHNLYNKKRRKSNKVLYFFILVSVIISVGISLSIPQVIAGTEKYLNAQASEINGGDLKIIEPYLSSKFDSKIEELEIEGYKINNITGYSININYKNNRLFCQLLVGDYDLEDDEVILYKDIADKLNVAVGDTITLFDQPYIIKAIDAGPFGVDQTSEMFGYCKVSKDPTTNNLPTIKIVIINGNNIDSVKSSLEEIEPNFTFTTLEDQKELINSKINMNIVALSTLNTMSIIMSILSVLSSIIMIIVERQKDIAIMRLNAIPSKAIRKAFRFELNMLFLIPIVIGAILSIPFSCYLLDLKKIEGVKINFSFVILGILLYVIIYYVMIHLATKAILVIKPLSIIKNEKISWKKSMFGIGFPAVLFTLLSFILYAIYIGKGSSILSSVAILLFIQLFFVITFLLIKLIMIINPKSNLLCYTWKSIKSNRLPFTLTVLCIALTMWFILFGFSMETTVKESYNKDVQQKISYNYMLHSKDPKQVEEELEENQHVEGYTVLYRKIGTYLSEDQSSQSSVVLGIIEQDKYQQRFQIIEGEDIFQSSLDEVLISKKFSNQQEITIGDSMEIWMEGDKISLTIKGIYESGGVNDNYILKAAGELDEKNNELFLIRADSESFVNNLTDASFIHVDAKGITMLKMISDFLLVFKYLCFICIIASAFFNMNMIYMQFINNSKETTIIRALGIGKGFLCKSMLIKYVMILIFSALMSIGLYGVLLNTALAATLNVNLKITMNALWLPILAILIMSVIYYGVSVLLIQKSKGYEDLREQV